MKTLVSSRTLTIEAPERVGDHGLLGFRPERRDGDQSLNSVPPQGVGQGQPGQHGQLNRVGLGGAEQDRVARLDPNLTLEFTRQGDLAAGWDFLERSPPDLPSLEPAVSSLYPPRAMHATRHSTDGIGRVRNFG